VVTEGTGITRLAILGSTGSIGTSCLDVVRAYPDRFQIVALTAHNRWELLADQTREFRPEIAVLTGTAPEQIDRSRFAPNTELRFGAEAAASCGDLSEVETVVAGIVGAAGLQGTWRAVRAGKRVAFANKETLVVAGPLMMDLARQTGALLLPVDSEHNAIFQAQRAGRKEEISRAILTASGGPFRKDKRADLSTVTPAEALRHPTWQMGPKITIDSATMMNKALEIIEARWLFDLSAEQLEVVVHPESIVHSLVEFVDGSVLAQLSPPDMRLPIQYALTYPERWPGQTARMDFRTPFPLQFEPPDLERFPALQLGFEVAARGGTSGAVLNAANEVAVQRFLEGNLRFTDIPRLCRSVIDAHPFEDTPSLEGVLQLDHWARQEALRWSAC
jgi:1-deoxy-D-xylulose-5-phosphate reductoisomerase